MSTMITSDTSDLPLAPAPTSKGRGRRLRVLAWWALALAAPLFVGATAWAALAPVESSSREELFEIPKGTWARRMAGNPVDILPSSIFLVLGTRDVLHLRNLDDVPQMFGPTLIMPGQSFRLPFGVAADYQFACTAHTSGQMTVVVDEAPTSAWTRLQLRGKQLWRAL